MRAEAQSAAVVEESAANDCKEMGVARGRKKGGPQDQYGDGKNVEKEQRYVEEECGRGGEFLADWQDRQEQLQALMSWDT